MEVVGNMSIESRLELDVMKIRCHCDHVFRAKVDTDSKSKPILRPDGRVSTPTGGKIVCPGCKCTWRRDKVELPDFGGWQFFAIYAKVEDREGEITLGIGYALNHAHFVADSLLPIFERIKLNLLKEYRVVSIDEDEFNTLVDEASMRRLQRTNNIFFTLFGG